MYLRITTILCIGSLYSSSFSALAKDDLLHLLLLHNNDMHSRFQETSASSGTCNEPGSEKCLGGFARTAHVIRQARALAKTDPEKREVLYLNAGDTYTGTSWFSVHGWKIATEFINALKPDVMSFGNHEFDSSIVGLVPFIRNVHTPFVAANLDYRNEPTLEIMNVPKSVVLTVHGRKIGVIGYLTKETKLISSSGEVIFLDEVESIRKESEKLDKEGVKIIIALGHSGFSMDRKIAKEVPLVDVVIGGHTNTFLYNGPRPDREKIEGVYPTVIIQSSGKLVPVVQAYAYTKYMGRLNVTFNAAGDLTKCKGQPLLLDHTIPQDKDILDLVEKYAPEVKALTTQVVGKSKVKLDTTEHNCRKMECNFGNLIADAFVYYRASMYAGEYWTDSPIGLMNGGGIRSDIDPGRSHNITRGELLGANPFDSQVISLQLHGSLLLETLEIAARSNGETSSGEFLQVSGLKVTYDMSRPSGSRVVEVLTRCGLCDIPVYTPLNLKKYYRIMINSFLAHGGDGHHILKDNGVNAIIEDLHDIDVISWYIGQFSPVIPEISGRITILNSQLSAGSLTRSSPTFLVILLVIGLLKYTFI